MTSHIELDEIVSKDIDIDDGDDVNEDEFSEDDSVKFKINTYGGSLDVNELVRRFDENDIFWPEFHRKFVWTQKQASQFIDSILMGLPIPSIFLYNDNTDNKLLIIDGLQRIMTFQAFKHGIWPESKTDFKLIGIPKKSKYFNKTFNELNHSDRQNFENTFIHILFIEQTGPDDNHKAAFHIFNRLNSGGVALQHQEMRNAIYAGNFSKFLVELNDNVQWRLLLGGKPHRRAKDQELILRFLALLNEEEKYKPPMKLFLNRFMLIHKKSSTQQLGLLSSQFTETLERIIQALGLKAFRVNNNSFSVPYFDSFMVAVASNKDASASDILNAYQALTVDSKFLAITRASTTNKKNVRRRLKIVREAIHAS